MRVFDVMTKDPVACSAADDLATAAAVMWNHDCGCVPVVDYQRKPVAALTDRDVCMAAYTQGLPLRAMTVSSAASKTVFTIGEDESIEAAEDLMRREQIRRLPVVDAAGKLTGVLSLNDLAHQAVHPGVRKGHGLTPPRSRSRSRRCASRAPSSPPAPRTASKQAAEKRANASRSRRRRGPRGAYVVCT